MSGPVSAAGLASVNRARKRFAKCLVKLTNMETKYMLIVALHVDHLILPGPATHPISSE
jgi:hypothetical protein